jgi:hypothetical protein
MAAINTRRVALGALAGGVVWAVWSFVLNMVILSGRYAELQKVGRLVGEPRVPLFVGLWFLTLFALAGVVAWLYALVRATRGPGPLTALEVGVLVGFAAGFPMNLSNAAWSLSGRVIAIWWMVDLWVGAILAALVAGWLYREDAARPS